MTMFSVLIILFSICFLTIAILNFNCSLFFLFLLLPTYLIRFKIGFLPTNLLEIMLLIVFLVFGINFLKNKEQRAISKLKFIIKNNYTFFIASALFLLGATISIFTAVDLKSAAGEWKAFYIEPFILFLILLSTFKNQDVLLNNKKSKIINLKSSIIFALVLSGLVTSILAIYQHYTGWMVPWDFWENRNTYRVTGWYGFPNGVGIFLAPIMPLAIYLIIENWKKLTGFVRYKKQDTKNKQETKNKLEIKNNLEFGNFNFICFLFLVSLFFIPCSILAIIYTKSTGALIGIIGAIGLLLIFYKKTRWPIIIIGIFGLLGLFSISGLSSLRQEILMQDRSGELRTEIWGETVAYLTQHPIIGTGLASYEERIAPWRIEKNIEIFHHPHNIFLTIWVNTGLLGLVGFVWMLILISKGIRNKEQGTIFVMASLICFLIMGLVDSPYIKNDWAIMFWMLMALLMNKEQRAINN